MLDALKIVRKFFPRVDKIVDATGYHETKGNYIDDCPS